MPGRPPALAAPGSPMSRATLATRSWSAWSHPSTWTVSLMAGRVKYRLGPCRTRRSTSRTDSRLVMAGLYARRGEALPGPEYLQLPAEFGGPRQVGAEEAQGHGIQRASGGRRVQQ